MEIVLEFIFSFLVEVFLPLFTELMFELGYESVANSVRDSRPSNPFLAVIGLLIMGAVSGLIFSWAFPRRVVPNVNLHGAGILISAVATGLLMMKYGQWRQMRGGSPSYLATFWGGSIFAASMALVRWGSVGIRL